MSSLLIRNFTPDDLPQVMELQQAYQKVYPNASVIPGEVYLSPSFGDGKNIFCALDERGFLQGYAPLLPVLTEAPQAPHTIWAEVKVGPQLLFPQEVRDSLFERVLNRAKEVVQTFPGHPAQLIFQYHPSETFSIEYVTSRGGVYSESVFRMMCDLTQELPAIPSPEQIEVRPWRMESEKEQQAYVRARNEVFSEAPITLADWQSFLHLPSWDTGTTFTAFDKQEIVGSVTVYWNETISQQVGRKTGFTEYIFVKVNWRKRGIAPFMIYQGLIYLKKHGCEAALLEVKATNQRALDLYYGLGYQLIDESHLYVFTLP